MTNENDLGKILKQRRIMIPMTLRELAAGSGVSAAHLGRVERGDRFPSAHVLQKIAKPLGFNEDEILTHAGYLSSQASTTKNETGVGTARIDPYVARVLAREPIASQHVVLGILSILKALGRAASSVDWPEFREYSRYKYPNIDEDLVTMIEDLISRAGM